MPNCGTQGIEVIQGMSQCASPTDAFFPASQGTPIMFSSILGGTNVSEPNPLTKNLVSGTWHVVFYDHGACRVPIPWNQQVASTKPLFDTISQSILDGLACIIPKCDNVDQLYDATRNFDNFQPHFVSQLGDIRHGFEFEADYSLHVRAFGVAQVFPHITINPAYSFSVDATTGLLAVTPLNQGLVVVVNDTSSNSAHKAMVKALTVSVPQAIESAIASQATIVPTVLGGPEIVPCDHTATLAAQQQTCFQQYTSVPPGGVSTAFTLLKLAFVAQGQSQADAIANANLAVSALEPRNFVCVPPTPANGLAADNCAVHPVVLRVNVLPDQFELVLAETFQDPARNALYAALTPELCGQPIKRCQAPDEGCPVPLVQHGPSSESTPTPGTTCDACQ